MKPLIVCAFIAFISGVLAASPEHLTVKWKNFKAEYGKQHPPHEEEHRMRRFLERDAEIEAHNARYEAGLESFSRQHSRYSDLTDDEVDQMAFGLATTDDLENSDDFINNNELSARSFVEVPESFDWRDHHAMTPAKDQGSCGACYAFAAAGVLESTIRLERKQAFDLSEQIIIDCTYRRYSNRTLNDACKSGTVSRVLQFFNETGVVDERVYPYRSGISKTRGRCLRVPPGGNIKGRLIYRRRRNITEEQLAEILYTYGPVAIGVAVDGVYKKDFIDLADGVFDHDESVNFNPNHAVVLVGYGKQGDIPYWIIKNSWGKKWGTRGYGKIRRGKNMCNILALGVWYIADLR